MGIQRGGFIHKDMRVIPGLRLLPWVQEIVPMGFGKGKNKKTRRKPGSYLFVIPFGEGAFLKAFGLNCSTINGPTMTVRLILIGFLSFGPLQPILRAQSTDCVEKDITDVFSKKGKEIVPEVVMIKHPSIILIPVLASSPATGFQLGVASQFAWYNANPEDTRISVASINFTYTAKSQILITAKSTIMGEHDKWIFSGDWRYYVYSQSTYGLGTNAPVSATVDDGINIGGVDTESTPGEEPMEFQWLRLHETALREIKRNVYLGLGYHLDVYASILDKNLDVPNGKLTEHYTYSLAQGIDPNYYSMSGLSANFVFDSRDNQINPYKGFYVNAQYRYNTTVLGSTTNSGLAWLEVRGYKSLSATKSRHILAGWAYTNFSAGGTLPYLGLPGTNYDMKNRSARAYVQGRFRGEDLVYAEMEYRFPISKCSGVLGGVLFVNGTTASNRTDAVKLFDYTKAGYGFGLRIAADKLSRTNIAIDVGFGEHSTGIYFGAAEVF